MDIHAVKGRAVMAIATALSLLVILIFLIRAGKTPILLGLLVLGFGIYGFRTLRSINNIPPKADI